MKSKPINRISQKLSVLSVLLAAVLICFIVHSGSAFAHGPGDLTVSYESATETLKVTITHTSKSTSKHYISKVEVVKNGVVMLTREYDSQPTKDIFSYEYNVPTEAGDVIEVKASCNIFGSKTTKLTIGPDEGSK
ncbi:MAG: hypothetical protein JXA41_15305 [Deltaproteobacteria bacterium]|nr:hypothetical protein [Deltaproteobacteria bacterium]